MEISYLIKNEKWEDAFFQYKKLYSENKCGDLALSFAFFCWYLLWRWDEISFYGENLSTYEKISADRRNGISKKDLEEYLSDTSDYILNCGKTEYIALIYHMKKIYPYFFKNSICLPIITDSETANIILNYSDTKKCKKEEKETVLKFFSRFALIKNYFEWLL